MKITLEELYDSSNERSTFVLFFSTFSQKESFTTSTRFRKHLSETRGVRLEPGNVNNFLGVLEALEAISLDQTKEETKKAKESSKARKSLVHKKFFESIGKKRNSKSPIYTFARGGQLNVVLSVLKSTLI